MASGGSPRIPGRAGAILLAGVALAGVALAACSPTPSSKPVATARPINEFRVDIVNRSRSPIVVWWNTADGASLVGLEAGQQASLLPGRDPGPNGISLEVLHGNDCSYFVPKSTRLFFPGNQPFTLVIGGGDTPGSGIVTVERGVVDALLPVPENGLSCPGG